MLNENHSLSPAIDIADQLSTTHVIPRCSFHLGVCPVFLQILQILVPPHSSRLDYDLPRLGERVVDLYDGNWI